ncbi:MAG: DUF192 domain-containing protein [Dermatophilaceae bacterium]
MRVDLPRHAAGPRRLRVDGRDVAPLSVADTPADRRRGLLGTSGIDGALWITRCPSVHMVGMRYPIDVAVVDRNGGVLRTATLRPWVGMTFPRVRAASTVEAEAGSMRHWGVRRGVRLSIGG